MVPNKPAAEPPKKETKQPKKSIDNLLEELKAKQKLREMGHEVVVEPMNRMFGKPLIPSGVPMTTVLTVANLSAKTTEEDLLAEFGRFGDITSVKLTAAEDAGEKQLRGLICFMDRPAAEEAREACQGKTLLGSDMKVGWGRAHIRPERPMFLRDPATGAWELNKALPIVRVSGEFLDDTRINALAEQVAKEGVIVEEFVKAREKDNPYFEWLVRPYGDAPTTEGALEANPRLAFYKWRVYSLAQGDTLTRWRTCPFQMFLNGVVWVPPIAKDRRARRSKDAVAKEAPTKQDEKGKARAPAGERRVTFALEPLETAASSSGPGLAEEDQDDFF